MREWTGRLKRLAWGVLLLALLWRPAPAHADARQAAVLIVPGGGAAPISACIAFTEETLSGAELLRRAQVDLVTQVSLVGEAVCKIGATGCAYPAENCFCQCLGAQCAYWSYWYREGEQWVYSGKGGSSRTVRHGDLDAWVWGDGQTPPPAASWEAICSTPSLASASSLTGTQGTSVSTPAPERSAPQEAYPPPEDTPISPNGPDPYPGVEPTSTRAPVAPSSPTPGETPSVRPTATARPTATPLERPDSPTPGAASPPAATPQDTRLATTSPVTPSPSAPLGEASPVVPPSPEAEPPSDVPAPPSAEVAALGTPSPDAVAIRIREGVAHVRATAAARNLQATQTSGSGIGYFVALAIFMLLTMGYVLLLRRQRAAALRQAMEQPASALDSRASPGVSGEDESPPAEETVPPSDDQAP